MMDELSIGTVGRPHGVHGEVRVRSHSGESAHFRDLQEVTLVRGEARRSMVISEIRIVGNTPVVRFEGVDSPERAQTLTGWEIVVPRERAAPLSNDEYYVHDLVGCDLIYGEEAVGTVAGVIEAPQAPLLEVRRCDGDPRKAGLCALDGGVCGACRYRDATD